MGAYNSGIRFSAEHREFAKDVAWVAINYTPLSGIIYTIKFGQKWLGDRGMHRRVARYMAASERKSFIKSRSRRIVASYERRGVQYKPATAY